MKKIQLKFATQKMTKEEMRKIRGGEEASCTLTCNSVDDYYIGSVAVGPSVCTLNMQQQLDICGDFYDDSTIGIAYCDC